MRLTKRRPLDPLNMITSHQIDQQSLSRNLKDCIRGLCYSHLKLSCQQVKSAKRLALSVQQIFSFLWLSVAVALGFLVWTLYDKIKVKSLYTLARHIWARSLVQRRTWQRLSREMPISILNGAFLNCVRDIACSDHSLLVHFLDSYLYHSQAPLIDIIR